MRASAPHVDPLCVILRVPPSSVPLSNSISASYFSFSCPCSERIDLNPTTSYQRLLVHRCSAYYKLVPEADTVTKSIFVYYRTDSRM